jgi:4-oxalocrotonate tautomerase
MPIIQVHLLEGRAPEVKKRFIEEITAAAVRTLDTKPEAVRVLLYELEPSHWAVGGKSKADDAAGILDQPGKG